jgi:hypothetical protein
MVVSAWIPDRGGMPYPAAVPLSAVVRSPRDPRAYAVYVVKSRDGHDVAELREVEPGPVLGTTIAIERGLEPGERAVWMGAPLLSDGEAVAVLP